jgi:hypothetical protein
MAFPGSAGGSPACSRLRPVSHLRSSVFARPTFGSAVKFSVKSVNSVNAHLAVHGTDRQIPSLEAACSHPAHKPSLVGRVPSRGAVRQSRAGVPPARRARQRWRPFRACHHFNLIFTMSYKRLYISIITMQHKSSKIYEMF